MRTAIIPAIIPTIILAIIPAATLVTILAIITGSSGGSLRTTLPGALCRCTCLGTREIWKTFRGLARLRADWDITEIDGFDNLNDAEEILLESQQRAAALWGAKHSRYLVNGSTGGILAAVRAALIGGGEVLAARNCHQVGVSRAGTLWESGAFFLAGMDHRFRHLQFRLSGDDTGESGALPGCPPGDSDESDL